MKSIKTYLLLLFLLQFSVSQVFAQTNIEKEILKKESNFSKADSVLVETYLTESDYNEKYGGSIDVKYENKVRVEQDSDEIYNKTSNRNKPRGRFLDGVAIEFIVDVTIHTVFLIAAFWQ